ncbi:MAG: amino acid ABC transporter ATP-binding protein [Candidatus Puniceispirillum sp.]|nr:amino acid ABC transporter ATP-binding protein [Candidatus Puniceispirillum sp.]
MTEKLPVIQIQDLHKSYDSLDVLKGVGLLAYEGSVVSLIGASGSGKSTLLRCANLLENSQSGDILFCGDAVRWTGTGTSRRPADKQQVQQMRSQLSMVFQQFNLWSHMTVLQNVTEAPVTVLQEAPHTVEARARSLLDKVGILDKADMYPAQLSGGQQQRAGIARALAMNPKAILLDEPTSALDPEMEQEVVQVIKTLAKEGLTMILVTHDMNLAHDVSDHVVFLHQGKILEEGTPQTLFKTPKSDRLQQFLRSTKITSV